MPQGDDVRRLGEEAVSADVEAVAVELFGATDAADLVGILLDERNRQIGLLGQQVAGGEAARPGADDEYVNRLIHAVTPSFKSLVYWLSCLPLQLDGELPCRTDDSDCLLKRYALARRATGKRPLSWKPAVVRA